MKGHFPVKMPALLIRAAAFSIILAGAGVEAGMTLHEGSRLVPSEDKKSASIWPRLLHRTVIQYRAQSHYPWGPAVAWSIRERFGNVLYADLGSVEPDPAQGWSRDENGGLKNAAGETFEFLDSMQFPAVAVKTEAKRLVFLGGMKKRVKDLAVIDYSPDYAKVLQDTGGAPKYLAYPTKTGVKVLPRDRFNEFTAETTPEAPWVLVWFGDETRFWSDIPVPGLIMYYRVDLVKMAKRFLHPVDMPLLFVFQNRPTAIEWREPPQIDQEEKELMALLGEKPPDIIAGLIFSFNDKAGAVALLPLLDFEYPQPAVTETWARNFPLEVAERAGWWSEHLAAMPTAVAETFEADPATDTVVVAEKFTFKPLTGRGKRLAPLPGALAIALAQNMKGVSLEATAADSKLRTMFGPFLGVEDVDAYAWKAVGLGKYALESAAPGTGAAPPELQAMLTGEIEKILKIDGPPEKVLTALMRGGGKDAPRRSLIDLTNPGEVAFCLSSALPVLDGGLRDKLLAWLLACPIGESRLPAFLPEKHWYTAQKLLPIENIYSMAEVYRCAGDSVNLADPDAEGETFELAKHAMEQWQARDFWHFMSPGCDSQALNWREPLYGVGGVLDNTRFFAGAIGFTRLAQLARDRQAARRGLYLTARAAVGRFALGKYLRYLYDSGIQQTPPEPDWMMRILDEIGMTEVGHLWTYRWTGAEDDARQVYVMDDWGPVITDYPCRPLLLPFHGLVPETGRFLADYLLPEARAFADRIVFNNPEWHMAFKEARIGDESYYDPPYLPHSFFMARAWALREDGPTLASYLDMPHQSVADIFYIHKLAETIKAYQGCEWTCMDDGEK